MKTDEIIEEIVRENKVEEVLKILLDILIEQRNNYKESDLERKASLVAIRKINNGKNETIDALSDIDNRYTRKGRRYHNE